METTQTTSNETALQTINNESIQRLTTTVQDAIALNEQSLSNAIKVADTILSSIRGAAMEDSPVTRHLDETCKSFLAKVAITEKSMKERREAITRFFDAIRKLFTSMENQLGKNGEKVAEIRAWRDRFATFLAEEERRKEQERAEKRLHDQELLDLRVAVKRLFLDELEKIQKDATRKIEKIFNSMNLTNVGSTTSEIKNFNAPMPAIATPSMELNRVTRKEFDEIVSAVTPSLEIEAGEQYKKHVEDTARYYLDRVESRRQELVRIAEANEADRKALEKAAEERRIAELERTNKFIADAVEKKKLEAEANKVAEELTLSFDDAPPPADVKKTLEIKVNKPQGWAQLFMFWFEREGKTLPNEKFEKFTFARIKKYCEDAANKSGEVITSNLVEYVEKVTAL
jgi:hypothetical protein